MSPGRAAGCWMALRSIPGWEQERGWEILLILTGLRGCCGETQRSFSPRGTHLIQTFTRGHPFRHRHRIASFFLTAGEDGALEAQQMGSR